LIRQSDKTIGGVAPGREAAPLLRNWRNDMRENLRRPLVTPTLRGVHHLALCTDDMKATIDFYVDVLGMPLVHAMKGAAWSWHRPRQSRQSTL